MLPFILAGVAIMVGTGAKKTSEGLSRRREAGTIADRATVRLKAAEKRLERATKITVQRITELQHSQQQVRRQIAEDLAPTLARVTNVGRKDWKALEAVTFDVDRLSSAWGVDPTAIEGLAKDTLIGVAAGLTMGKGAIAAASSMGFASTGIAIGELSGAAATNASLAWLGGGALSAGGWGMAGGALALNALAVGPGALLAGLAVARSGEKRKTSAVAYAAKVDKAVAREALMHKKLQAIRLRAKEVLLCQDRLSSRAAAMAESVNLRLDANPACSFPELDASLQDMFLILGGLTGLLNTLSSIQIVDEAGELTPSRDDDPVSRARSLEDAQNEFA